MKVKISTTNWVCGEILSADRIEIRFDTLIVEGDGVDISIPFNPGDVEIQVWVYTPQGVTLTLEGRYSIRIPSGLSIRSFHDGSLEIKAHRDALCVKAWRYKALRLEEAEAE